MSISQQRARRLLFALLLAPLTQGCPDNSPNPGQPIQPVQVTKNDMDMTMDMTMDMPTDSGPSPDMVPDMMAEPDLPPDLAPDLGCTPESKLQFCMRYNYSCGELEAEDNCGEIRTEVCGEMCSLPQSCAQEVDDNDVVLNSSCICNFENVVEVCNSVGKLCGPLAPPCEGMMCDNFCVDSLASGGTFNCAQGSGNLKCWGTNRGGQLGLGDRASQKNPTSVEIPLNVVEIAAGEEHACAILDDTSLICWGSNEFGQLGISTTVDQLTPDLTDPNSRAFVKGVAKVVLSDKHTCALVDDDFDPVADPAPKGPYTAYCWGSNLLGAIGNTDIVVVGTDAGTPIRVKGLSNKVIDIAVAYGHTCAIVDEGDAANRIVQCWGSDEGGQLGVRDIESAPLYTLNNTGRRDIMDGTVPNGTFHHYMNNRIDQNIIVVPTPATVRTDAPDTQVTSGEFINSPLSEFRGAFEEIDLGRYSSCVRSASGDVFCWGVLSVRSPNIDCDLPPYWNTTTTQQDYLVQQGTPNVSIAKLPADRCATWPLQRDWTQGPTILMLGNRSGQPSQYGIPGGIILFRAVAPRPTQLVHHPDDPSIHPPYLTGGETVKATQISIYNDHVCMLLDDAAYLPGGNSQPAFSNVYCFGLNEDGQLGNGTNSPQGFPMGLTKDINAQIVRAQKVDVGTSHSCAVAENNNILCWGSNADGQLGNENLLKDESFRPFDVLLR